MMYSEVWATGEWAGELVTAAFCVPAARTGQPHLTSPSPAGHSTSKMMANVILHARKIQMREGLRVSETETARV